MRVLTIQRTSPTFVLVLVDREEGGRANIESKGYPVASLFRRSELVDV